MEMHEQVYKAEFRGLAGLVPLNGLYTDSAQTKEIIRQLDTMAGEFFSRVGVIYPSLANERDKNGALKALRYIARDVLDSAIKSNGNRIGTYDAQGNLKEVPLARLVRVAFRTMGLNREADELIWQ